MVVVEVVVVRVVEEVGRADDVAGVGVLGRRARGQRRSSDSKSEKRD